MENKKVIALESIEGQEKVYEFTTFKVIQDFDGNDVKVPDATYTKTVSELNGTIGSSQALINEAQEDLGMIQILPLADNEVAA
jgi:hypothetical protein